MSEKFGEVLRQIERLKRKPVRLREKAITMAHGAGGKATHDLVAAVFLEAFRNPLLERLEDQATFELNGMKLALTTDAFTVYPHFFKGGDIGCLSVHGTINDLATAGARPLFLAAAFVLEEGFPIEDLRRIVESMAEAARRCNVQVVTGDTKTVQRGKGDGVYIVTTGIGIIEHPVNLSTAGVRPGDKVILSGTIGEHGIAVMIARGNLELEAEIESDTAPLWDMVDSVLKVCPRVRCMRDPTRGGVATVLNEIAQASQVCIRVFDEAVPVRPEVRGACEILGIDPLYVANEGKMLFVVPPEDAERVLTTLKQHPLGKNAALIGEVEEERRVGKEC
ncbi:MAG: hydrogenase expression/formation protein HypE, partial [Armatimonadota bacterium]|nr:hydrogenase expression/formation protein HypE [Armatimonadota bacterium]MDW8141975.1 hydrogenase expression/formation protein HypE [Armatimonadota bacterium]